MDKYFGEALNNFAFKKHKHGFIKSSDDNFFIFFGYALYDSDNSFPTQFGIRCGLKTIDKVYNVIMEESSEYLNLHSVSQAGLYEEKKYPKLEYDLHNESDIKLMVKEVTEYLKKEALPFFENLNSIKNLEKYRNDNLIPQQAKTGIILARLAGNLNYEKLKEQYRLLLKEWPEHEKKELEKVINYLDNSSNEKLLKLISN